MADEFPGRRGRAGAAQSLYTGALRHARPCRGDIAMPLTLATMQEHIDRLFPGLMGVRLVDMTPARVVAELTVRPDLCTAGGILHGGAYMAFADTLGAVGTILNMPEGKMTTTTDSSTKFISGAKAGTTVRGESVGLHRGRFLLVWLFCFF